MTASQLDQIANIGDPTGRALAVTGYLQRGRESLAAARRLRDSTITVLLDQGVKMGEIAEICGVSVSHIKLVKRIRDAAEAAG